MSIAKGLIWPMCLIVTLITGQNVVSAQEQSQDRDRMMERDYMRLRERIHKETDLSDEELKALGPSLREHLRIKGKGEQLRAMIRESLDAGCKGTCLSEMIRTMNHAMTRGLSEEEARKRIASELRTQMRERERQNLSDKEVGERVRSRVEKQIDVRERKMKEMHERSMEREMAPGRKKGGAGGYMEKKGGM